MQILSENNNQERIAKVREGTRFLLSHLEGRQQLFPRKMSTASSKDKQFIVFNEDQILNECIKANFIDCRLNAYPYSECAEYLTVTNTDHQNSSFNIFSAQAPNVIFIDRDFQPMTSEIELLKQQNKISKIIKNYLNGSDPTVLWTGNGFHFYIVLDTRPLELITDLVALSKEPSKDFLKFAENRLSGNKADPKHNASFRSYLLRIPYTLNSKCVANGTDPEVKIIKKFDPNDIPKISLLLLREFRLYLADQDMKNKAKVKVFEKKSISTFSYPQQILANYVPKCYQWIENNLLEKPLSDHRKYTIDLLLAPFLTNIRHLSYNESCSVINGWIQKCNSANRLQPSLVYFEDKIKDAINSSIQKATLPIKQETMAAKYPRWFSDFRKWHLLDDIF